MFSTLKKQILLFMGLLILSSPIAAMEDIPLPKQSAFTGKGLAIGIGVGVFNPSGDDCNCIGMWQAHVDYFYLPYLSGGADIRFYGGDVDRHSMIIYQRYQLHLRYHKKIMENLAFYGAPLIGFETTDLHEIKKNITTGEPIDTELEEDVCTESFALNGFSMGFDLGVGLKVNKDFGLVTGALYEFNFSDFHYMALTAGVTFKIRNHWKRLEEGMLSSWLSLEIQWQRYLGTGDGLWSETILLGLFFGV